MQQAQQDAVALTNVTYYCRERLFHTMGKSAQKAIQKATRGGDSAPGGQFVRVLHAYALMMQTHVQDAIRDLDALQSDADDDVNLAKYLALMTAHKMGQTVDQDGYSSAESRLKQERRTASPIALTNAATFLTLTGRPEKGREYAERALKTNPQLREALCAKGWIDLQLATTGDDVQAAGQLFESAISAGQSAGATKKWPDALFGLAAAHERRQNYPAALEMMNQAIVSFPNLVPALIEKMKLQLCLRDWDQAIDTAQRCKLDDAECIPAYVHLALYGVTQAARNASPDDKASSLDAEKRVEKLQDLFDALNSVEPNNAELFNALTHVFSRCAGGSNAKLLQITDQMTRRAVQIDPVNAQYLCEAGFHQLLLGKASDALKLFERARSIDMNHPMAAGGEVRCHLMLNKLKEAQSNFDFIRECEQSSSAGLQSETYYLAAVLQRKHVQNGTHEAASGEKAVELLNRAFESHYRKAKDLPLSVAYYSHLNPLFMLEIVTEYLSHSPDSPPKTKPGVTSPAHPLLKKSQAILNTICRTLPGLLDATFLLGKVKFLLGDFDTAIQHLTTTLETEPGYTEASILTAQCYLQQENFTQANHWLEHALSYNFAVREHPLYQLIHARVLKKVGNHEEADAVLSAAMKTINRAQQLTNLPGGGSGMNNLKLTSSDKVALFLETIDSHLNANRQPEALKVMEDGLKMFRGTPDEFRLQMANADLALKRGDIEGALSHLRVADENHPFYRDCKLKVAEIQLDYKRDKRAFVQCFVELREKQPSLETLLMLGDAYMRIGESTKAIEIYEDALRKNSKDYALASKIGQALVKTHNYTRAITYYEAAVQGISDSAKDAASSSGDLYYELLELLVRLKQMEKATRLLQKLILEEPESASDALLLYNQGRYLRVRADIHKRRGELSEAIATLQKSRLVVQKALHRGGQEHPDKVPAMREQFFAVNEALADCLSNKDDTEGAITALKQIAGDSGESTAATKQQRLQLARLFFQQDKLEEAERIASAIIVECGGQATLNSTEKASSGRQNAGWNASGDGKDDFEHKLSRKIAPSLSGIHSEAVLLLADILLRQEKDDLALSRLQRMVEVDPLDYHALARLVDLLRRAGRLSDVPHFLQLSATASGSRCKMEPGFNYCSGLYEWYVGNTNEALKLFNKARRDSTWGKLATYNMVEICINPDGATLGGELIETALNPHINADEDASANEKNESEQLALRTADRLLKELRASPFDYQHDILQNLLLIKSRNEQKMEKAIKSLVEKIQQVGQLPGLRYALAVAHSMSGETAKAKQILKRLASQQWSADIADYLEKAWLLTADIYIKADKEDTATEILQHALRYNKSCTRAYEYLGYLAEREKQPDVAAQNYEKAWLHSNKTNPAIGYKLAVSYMKISKHIEAIEVVLTILKTHPKYPRVQKEILEKARNQLRL